MVAAGEAGKEEEPHCDVMEALPGCWGVVRANLVVWRGGAGQSCQRGASVEEERAGEKRGEVTRHGQTNREVTDLGQREPLTKDNDLGLGAGRAKNKKQNNPLPPKNILSRD